MKMMLPCQKDKVSIATNVHMQKKLLLVNLNELYSSFNFEHPDLKMASISFVCCDLNGAF